MSVQTITLSGRRFVILSESDYRKLAKGKNAKNGKTGRVGSGAQERGDFAEAKRRENEPSVPLKTVRARLGL